MTEALRTETERNEKRLLYADSDAPGYTLPAYFSRDLDKVMTSMVTALDLVPDDATRVLDAGCALGNSGRLLKSRRSVDVVGIEMIAEAAEVASSHLDDVICADLDLRPELPHPAGYFDTMLFLDVLEHIVLPEQAVRHLLRWLSPGGSAIFSIPNVFHVSVLLAMFGAARRFSGTAVTVPEHLRFFMITDIVNLMDRLNLTIHDPIYALVTEANPAEEAIGDLAAALGSTRERAAFESRVTHYVFRTSPVLDGETLPNAGRHFSFESRYELFHSAEDLGMSAGSLGA